MFLSLFSPFGCWTGHNRENASVTLLVEGQERQSYRCTERVTEQYRCHITRCSRDLCAVMSTRFQRDIVTCGYYILYTVGFASYRTKTAGWYPQTLQVESVDTTDLNQMCFKSAVLTSTDTKCKTKRCHFLRPTLHIKSYQVITRNRAHQ